MISQMDVLKILIFNEFYGKYFLENDFLGFLGKYIFFNFEDGFLSDFFWIFFGKNLS